MKAISPLVSHSIFMAVGIVVLIFISAMIWYIYDSYIKETINVELNKNIHIIADEISKLYSLKSSSINPQANTSVLLGSVDLILPEKVAGRNYIIELQQSGSIWISNLSENNVSYNNAMIIGKTFAPEVTVNYTLFNMDVNVQGYIRSGKNATLRYFRANVNGTKKDTIVLGNSLVVFVNIQ